MYQLQNFINTMGDLCEFSFLEGPLNVAKYAPIKFFVDRGIVPPYKRWLTHNFYPFDVRSDGTVAPAVSKTEVNYGGILETAYYIIDYMNRQEEPFDGFAGFSQGVYAMQAVLKSSRYFPKQLRLNHRLPFFCIDFNGLNL